MASCDDRELAEIIARRFVKLVQKEIDVKRVYLYGSSAKGNFTQDSDIDIVVVGDDFIGDPVEDTMLLMRIRRKVDYRIEPRPFKTSDFNESNPLSKEIMETGIAII